MTTPPKTETMPRGGQDPDPPKSEAVRKAKVTLSLAPEVLDLMDLQRGAASRSVFTETAVLVLGTLLELRGSGDIP